MIGIILATLGTFFDEISLSFGKWAVSHNKENIYTFGFLNFFWMLIIFIIFAIAKNSFIFDPASIPLFIVLIILEIAQVYSSLNAIVKADRSTSGFLLIITIPLLLIVDTFLGYKIGIYSLLGVVVIIVGLIILLTNHGLNKKGIWYVIFSAVNAVATISIYKYCITHYNSVEAQQIIISVFMLIFLYIMSVWKSKESPLKYIFKKEFFIRSVSMGIGSVIISFAYLFAPSSIITSAKRASSILWSIISGNHYFHEKHILVKITAFLLIIVGLALMLF
ncbi:MAG: hypothetical protein UR85_C0006G0051 [Candidatus Nomurabacteria bacterium GW2011_GWF2_35_66]|uniref:EamA domain-containing protein n=1 Tax=Candidatus Nomurabacteria bacterium GW2011_GWE1_35_16 TaxID=1618761 RepID=A0A0G0BPU0_9BACT|nr:MAG: hypothetical protein UR55_C0008G0032 [Candidatus Nomurabacteria bacterium GW2011_GWF1_34_20]KKP63180.1 MAG: hypothetical protein UR57_C0008G0051 [Candidatus Nomurabacteria bacterium GW2011_GWE2_34_25]KKP65646.1 MAG: hypothetical protein UR64_C0022G0006 [Candidatus Nomurabacteria bacterium GW2011_GWE1_35_16]KKP83266.1 MAG: hypothetical protein UR85_C0006G0051 [Candidatus Nomurabacteria bacterium GW2011_GWF2_35_66]HAE36718.1 hypothetical protein [Candidatus Nomurabacteria bacterium]